MKRLNPVLISILTIVSSLLLALIIGFVSERLTRDSGKATELAVYFIYLTPLLGVVSWILSLIAQKQWVKTHKMTTIVFSLLLLALIVFDIYSVVSH